MLNIHGCDKELMIIAVIFIILSHTLVSDEILERYSGEWHSKKLGVTGK